MMDMPATHSIAARRGGNDFIPGAAIDERVAQIDANGAITFIHNDKQNSKCAIALRATLARGVIAISDGVGNPVVRRGYGTYGETDPAQTVGTTSAGTSAPPALRAFYGSKRSPGPFSLLRKPPPKPFGYTGRRWDPDLSNHRACRTHKAPPQRQPPRPLQTGSKSKGCFAA
jgi:hypothetical protein